MTLVCIDLDDARTARCRTCAGVACPRSLIAARSTLNAAEAGAQARRRRRAGGCEGRSVADVGGLCSRPAPRESHGRRAVGSTARASPLHPRCTAAPLRHRRSLERPSAGPGNRVASQDGVTRYASNTASSSAARSAARAGLHVADFGRVPVLRELILDHAAVADDVRAVLGERPRDVLEQPRAVPRVDRDLDAEALRRGRAVPARPA